MTKGAGAAAAAAFSEGATTPTAGAATAGAAGGVVRGGVSVVAPGDDTEHGLLPGQVGEIDLLVELRREGGASGC